MRTSAMRFVLLAIAEHVGKGGAFELWVRMRDGTEYRGAAELQIIHHLVILTKEGHPPLYLDLAAIIAAKLASDDGG